MGCHSHSPFNRSSLAQTCLASGSNFARGATLSTLCSQTIPSLRRDDIVDPHSLAMDREKPRWSDDADWASDGEEEPSTELDFATMYGDVLPSLDVTCTLGALFMGGSVCIRVGSAND